MQVLFQNLRYHFSNFPLLIIFLFELVFFFHWEINDPNTTTWDNNTTRSNSPTQITKISQINTKPQTDVYLIVDLFDTWLSGQARLHGVVTNSIWYIDRLDTAHHPVCKSKSSLSRRHGKWIEFVLASVTNSEMWILQTGTYPISGKSWWK